MKEENKKRKENKMSQEVINDTLKKIELLSHVVSSLSGDNIQVTIHDVRFFGSREKLISQLARLKSTFNALGV